jgi:hypothetical protein
MNQLLEWLEAGAPAFVFNMHSSVVSYDKHSLGDSFIFHQVKEKGLGECGTMCCIAGWAAQKHKNYETGFYWDTVGHLGRKYLGLPLIENQSTEDGWFFHPLFNPHLAPPNCTADQAAQAVRNTIADAYSNPWVGVY